MSIEYGMEWLIRPEAKRRRVFTYLSLDLASRTSSASFGSLVALPRTSSYAKLGNGRDTLLVADLGMPDARTR